VDSGREEEPIKRHLPLRGCPGAFERWRAVHDEVELLHAVREARAEKMPLRVIPPFSDALPPEGGVGGLALRLAGDFERIIVEEGGELSCGSSVPLALLGLRPGFAPLRSAGGTVGDAVLDGWLTPAVVRIRRLKGRGFEDVASYEPDPRALIVRVWLRPAVRLAPVPAGTAFSAVARRGVTLRSLLARSGVASIRLRDAALAEHDAAVIVNRGEATPKELRLLLRAVAEKVKVASGIELVERLVPPGRGVRL
jgi:hypothetical protein